MHVRDAASLVVLLSVDWITMSYILGGDDQLLLVCFTNVSCFTLDFCPSSNQATATLNRWQVRFRCHEGRCVSQHWGTGALKGKHRLGNTGSCGMGSVFGCGAVGCDIYNKEWWPGWCVWNKNKCNMNRLSTGLREWGRHEQPGEIPIGLMSVSLKKSWLTRITNSHFYQMPVYEGTL